MTMLGQEKPSLEDLSHHGVKGMKWGVHREARLTRLSRVADGSASKSDRAKVALTEISNSSLRKGGGLEGAAKVKAAELQARKDRIQSGKATIGDRVALTPVGRLRDNSGAKAQKAQRDVQKTQEKMAKRQAKLKTAAAQEKFYQDKADRILKTAMEDHESLIALRTQNDAVIVTGKQFIEHMTNGGLMNIKATDVYATRNKTASGKSTGPYVLNPNINRPFQPNR